MKGLRRAWRKIFPPRRANYDASQGQADALFRLLFRRT